MTATLKRDRVATTMTAQAPKKLFISTSGCQMNVYDSHRIYDVLRPLGYAPATSPEDADMVILNTCHIREKATDKVFSELGRMKEHKDNKKKSGGRMILAVAGCVAQAEGDVITTRAPYVDLVVGPQTYGQLPDMVNRLTMKYGERRIINTDFPAESKFDDLPATTSTQGPSAFLSVQEGCDKFCTFCVVPYTRGSEFSRPVTSVIDEAKRVLDTGASDITLLGQNVNAYHGDGPDGAVWGLGQLISELAKLPALKRIRYMTSHPRDMADDLIEAHRDVPQLMPICHLPVQSGSDKILKAMNRKHTADDYFKIIDRLRDARPDIAFSSDFIVGFPGETDDDHAATIRLIEQVRFASAYSFKYSARPGTPAAVMGGLIHEDVKTKRLHMMQDLLFKQANDYNSSFIGKNVLVLFDKYNEKSGQLHGRTPHNQAVHCVGHPRLVGQIMDVAMTSASASALHGDLPAQ
jgi:tRNA-2-methylthio-N6-dimethylallyladenosine synthase